VEAHIVSQSGQQGILLRDPLRLADRAVFLPQSLSPLLQLCDGTRDPSALRASLAVRAGVQIGPSVLEQVLAQLDEALLLDNDRFARKYEEALRSFRTATQRVPILAGQGYPADPDELEAILRSYGAQVGQPEAASGEPEHSTRGLVSPHIDFERGGPIYYQVWQRAAVAVREAELAIIFGTDHVGSARLTFTHQRYATPFGTLPTANGIVDQVAHVVGSEIVFGAELHHRSEHSIELAVVWLHHILGDHQCSLMPVLCGGFERYIGGDSSPSEDEVLQDALGVLREAAEAHRTVVIAAGDLAHVGPAFGDRYGIDILAKARLKTSDESLMSSICSGDAEGFLELIRSDGDRSRVCGLPPIYMALSLLGAADGEVTGYAQCPADQTSDSYVSICGIVWH
jgi:AmmeMemoRadiSam system protein B